MANENTIKSSLTPADEKAAANMVENSHANAATDDSAEDAVQAIKGVIARNDEIPEEC